jgi:hypothetical protein
MASITTLFHDMNKKSNTTIECIYNPYENGLDISINNIPDDNYNQIFLDKNTALKLISYLQAEVNKIPEINIPNE